MDECLPFIATGRPVILHGGPAREAHFFPRTGAETRSSECSCSRLEDAHPLQEIPKIGRDITSIQILRPDEYSCLCG